jgi:hypothetical protein
MPLRKSAEAEFAILAAMALLAGCNRPTSDAVKLAAIEAEARTLMTGFPAEAAVPKAQWPQAIASLEPESVAVDADGVHITTKAYFDGGWGYFVPRRREYVPEPAGQFREVRKGVYWWHPY